MLRFRPGQHCSAPRTGAGAQPISRTYPYFCPCVDRPVRYEGAMSSWKEIQEYVRDQVYTTRKKDFENPFRQATYRNMDEMTAAIGTIEDNSFVKQVRGETEEFEKRIQQIKKRG